VHKRVGVGRSLRQSWGLLRARPGVMIALGGGVVLSLISVCCGIGVVMAPWLLCELVALQLAETQGRPVERNRSWVGAGLILLGAVMLTASVGWLTWLGLGTDATQFAATARSMTMRVVDGAGLVATASALVSLVFVLPFVYAPLILLEARANFGDAILESARLTDLGGASRSFGLSLAANIVQLSPVLAAGVGAAIVARDDVWPLLVLLSVPLLSLSVPLGQGMLVSAYAELREDVADQSRTRLAGRPPGALVVTWIVIAAAPVLSFGMLGASLVRPSRMSEGQLPTSKSESVAAFAPLIGQQRVHPPSTALEIVVDAKSARVVASDGGGAGKLPLRSAAPIEGLRVVRVRERFGIELSQNGQASVTWIDGAGVRLDDDLRARLLDHVPSWALLAMLASLFATASALLPVLAALAELRRLYTLQPGERPAPSELSRVRRRTLRRALIAAVVLTPLAVLSLYWGAQSLL